ncbi:MAG TPA: hypothetical protein VL179_05955, partial [Mycobacterium sp.]|nr:hypothetical protein [Mycobacterium sp.]
TSTNSRSAIGPVSSVSFEAVQPKRTPRERTAPDFDEPVLLDAAGPEQVAVGVGEALPLSGGYTSTGERSNPVNRVSAYRAAPERFRGRSSAGESDVVGRREVFMTAQSPGGDSRSGGLRASNAPATAVW